MKEGERVLDVKLEVSWNKICQHQLEVSVKIWLKIVSISNCQLSQKMSAETMKVLHGNYPRCWDPARSCSCPLPRTAWTWVQRQCWERWFWLKGYLDWNVDNILSKKFKELPWPPRVDFPEDLIRTVLGNSLESSHLWVEKYIGSQ